MADLTAIEWTDSTVNFWWGCTKVSPGCDHCYAEAWNDFRGNKQWGPGAPRREIKGAVALIRKLQRSGDQFEAEHGRRRRVFMQSMSDNFDNEVPEELRGRMFAEAEAADRLDIQMLTKRGINVPDMIPAHWKTGGWARHIGLMISVTSQKEAARDIPRLLRMKKQFNIPWVGVSAEPLLGGLNLRALNLGNGIELDALTGQHSHRARNGLLSKIWHDAPGQPGPLPPLDWVIVGGESGRLARPLHPDWVMSLKVQCSDTGTAFLFKQWGEWAPVSEMTEAEIDAIYRSNRIAKDHQDQAALDDIYGRTCKVANIVLYRDGNQGCDYPNGAMTMFRIGKHRSGRTLRGQTHTEFPRRAA